MATKIFFNNRSIFQRLFHDHTVSYQRLKILSTNVLTGAKHLNLQYGRSASSDSSSFGSVNNVERVQPKQFGISFEEYQKLKRAQRNRQRMAGIPFALCGTTASSFLMAYMNPDMFDAPPDSVQLIFGLDPLVFSGISGVVAGCLGFVFGMNVYKFGWAFMNKTTAENLQEREADFLNRLDKFRFGGDSKFEDDYYGESIKTLSDYRQWVRTHQRKKETSEKYQIGNLGVEKTA